MPPGVLPVMEILTLTELRRRYEEIKEQIQKGDIFIHPSDTIYGLGCNALNEQSVQKIRAIKEQFERPLSVWAPSLEWITKNCIVNQEAASWLKKLPGPYTLILGLKNKHAVAAGVIPNTNTIGIRIPDHWFSKVVEKIGIPIVTTSANKTGSPFMTNLENLDSGVEKKIKFMIYEGEKSAHPSKIINIVEGTVKER